MGMKMGKIRLDVGAFTIGNEKTLDNVLYFGNYKSIEVGNALVPEKNAVPDINIINVKS